MIFSFDHMTGENREYVLYNPSPPLRKMIKFWFLIYGEYVPSG